MIEFYVSGQSLRVYTPVIAADTLNYLTAKVWFLGDEWAGYTRWLHFRRGEGVGTEVYDLILDGNDSITEDKGLNLTAGEWTVYLSGNKESGRLTNATVILTVKESGLVDAPLHAMPLSVAEQIANDASAALVCAREVKEQAEAGAFNGRDGLSFVIAGYYDDARALAEAVTQPQPGEAYGVGAEAPYDIYIWDAVNGSWRNNGCIQGVKGDNGSPGATFRPSVDAGGNISWTNDGGLENPAAQNIRGPAGRDGAQGPAGASAFEAAVDAGYQGTEATFNAALAALPYHGARHLPGGADPISVGTGSLEDGAVTAEKLASGAVSVTYSAELDPAAWQERLQQGRQIPLNNSLVSCYYLFNIILTAIAKSSTSTTPSPFRSANRLTGVFPKIILATRATSSTSTILSPFRSPGKLGSSPVTTFSTSGAEALTVM